MLNERKCEVYNTIKFSPACSWKQIWLLLHVQRHCQLLVARLCWGSSQTNPMNLMHPQLYPPHIQTTEQWTQSSQSAKQCHSRVQWRLVHLNHCCHLHPPDQFTMLNTCKILAWIKLVNCKPNSPFSWFKNPYIFSFK